MTTTRVDVELPDGGCGECELFESNVLFLGSACGVPMEAGPDGTDPFATGVCTLTGFNCTEGSPACVLKEEAEP